MSTRGKTQKRRKADKQSDAFGHVLFASPARSPPGTENGYSAVINKHTVQYEMASVCCLLPPRHPLLPSYFFLYPP